MFFTPVIDFCLSLARLTGAGNTGYALPAAFNKAAGCDRPNSKGAIAMRRPVHGFFYALHFYGGVVYWGAVRLGGSFARSVNPVYHPTAQKFDSFERWLTIAKELQK